MTEINTEVEMVQKEGGAAIIKLTQFIKAFAKFGAQVKISPKANCTLNKPGFKAEYFTETVTVTVGIGADHTAELIMTKDAWDALRTGAPVSVTTIKEFEKLTKV